MPYVIETPSERVARELRAELEPQPSGTPVPSVRELSERFDVAKATVSKAIALLVSEGLIVTRARYGMFRA